GTAPKVKRPEPPRADVHRPRHPVGDRAAGERPVARPSDDERMALGPDAASLPALTAGSHARHERGVRSRARRGPCHPAEASGIYRERATRWVERARLVKFAVEGPNGNRGPPSRVLTVGPFKRDSRAAPEGGA